MRRSDWTVRLQDCITRWRAAPFQYGKHDCALFAAAAVHAMTDVDLARGLRGYRTEAGGLKKVRAAGFENHVDVFRKALTSSDQLRAGDIAVLDTPEGEALGVVQGRGVYVMTPTRGLALVPRSWIKTGMTV